MTIALTGTLVLVGAGKMGGAMLEGWIKGGKLSAKIIRPAYDRDFITAKGVITGKAERIVLAATQPAPDGREFVYPVKAEACCWFHVGHAGPHEHDQPAAYKEDPTE